MEEREGEKREKGRDPERSLEDGKKVEARLNKKRGGENERETEIQRKGETKPGKKTERRL